MHRSFVHGFVVPVVALGLVACAGQIKPDSSGGNGGNGGNPDVGNIHAADGGGGVVGDVGADKTCDVAADCGTNPGAKCARTCKDGSNPCGYTCSSTHQCVMRGCPEDDAPSGCTPECTGGNVCVRRQFQGGPIVTVDDAGACPMGRHAEGNVCVPDPTYACEPKPALCGDVFDCSCASTVCTGGYVCRGTTRHEIDCELDAP